MSTPSSMASSMAARISDTGQLPPTQHTL
jgi:hypothetical protein